MRIIHAPDDKKGCMTRRVLAATMLNIEHGARVVSDAGEPLARQLPGFNNVLVPPLTDGAPAVTYHVRPAVGIVFHTPCSGFDQRELLEEMAAQLGAHGRSHLTRGHRVVKATPSALLYHHGRVADVDRVIASPRRHAAGEAAAPTYPARMFIEAPAGEAELPSHISYRAAFTWIFMSLAPMINVVEVTGMKVFNAQVASVVYDAARVLSVADRAVRYSLSSADLCIPALAPGLRAAMATLEQRGLAILVDPEERELVLLSPDHTLCCAERTTVLGSYPLQPGKKAGESCFTCEMPTWGEYLSVRGLRWPGGRGLDGELEEREEPELKRGEPVRGEDAPLHACRYCFRGFPVCFDQHFAGAQITRVDSGLTQAQALAGDATYRKLLPLLRAGRPEIIREGGFRVGSAMLLLATSKYPKETDFLRDSELVGLGLPPVCYKKIVVRVESSAGSRRYQGPPAGSRRKKSRKGRN